MGFDPLLITPDVSWQQGLCNTFSSSLNPTMARNDNTYSFTGECISWQDQDLVANCAIDSVPNSVLPTPTSQDSIAGNHISWQEQDLKPNCTKECINPVLDDISNTSPTSQHSIPATRNVKVILALLFISFWTPFGDLTIHSLLLLGKFIKWQDQNIDSTTAEEPRNPMSRSAKDGRSISKFSLSTPDLVICSSSPDLSRSCYNDPCMSLEATHVEISLEDGINGHEEMDGSGTKYSASYSEASLELLPVQMTEKESGDNEVEEEFTELRIEYEFQKDELTETKKALEGLKRENECKTRECHEALKSLRDLQNELMRKSMHVGSLAFAIEGQVKEKSKLCSSLRDLKRKLKILKMDQLKVVEEASLLYQQCMKDMIDVSCSIQSKLNEEVKVHEDLKVKFLKGAKERKELYNKVLELKGNIRVFCRCRPLNSEEIDSGAAMAIDFEASKDGELTVKSSGLPKKTFKFDAVFSPQSNQVDVFEDTAPFATSVLDGYNVCIFAYGQTGTGKTFTMEGTEGARGVNYRTLQELFDIISERKGQFNYELSVSVLEVYNEQIRDLLLPGTQPTAPAKRLEIRQAGEGTHHVPGLVEANVNNMNEVWEVLKTGSDARAVGSTNANEYSSRSHCIHCVMVKGKNLLSGEMTRSKLWLVDLAGSERVAKTEVQGDRLKETQSINRSLSALGDVISSLATKNPHIPFRNSKLTHLLQDSLGGDSKTLMFVQISPNENDLSETLCSLNFASRVRGIELGPARKQVDNSDLLKYKLMSEKTKLDLKSKDVQIKKMEDTIHGLDVRVKERDMKNKSLQEKIKELESQLLIERKLARQHVDTKLAEQQQQQLIRQEAPNTPLSRPPLTTKPIGTYSSFNEPKEQPKHTRSLSDNDDSFDCLDEKENNPKLIQEQPLIQKRIGRSSLCPLLQKIPISLAPPTRRNSLIPLPTSALGLSKFSKPLVSLPPIQDNIKQPNIEPPPCISPKEQCKNGGKKMSFVLRRSVQKRFQTRNPMNQVAKRGGVNAAMEKCRVSVTSRGRLAHRVLKQNQRERVWNTGNAGKIAI